VRKVQYDADALQHASRRFRNFEPDGGECFDYAGAIDLIDGLPPNAREDMPFEARKPTCVMAFLPSVAEGLAAGAGRCFEGRDDLSRLAPLGNRIEAIANFPAQQGCGLPSFGQRNVMSRTQTIVAALAIQLHSQHPRPRTTRLDQQAKAPAIDMATRLGILHFQYRQRHQVRVPVGDSCHQKGGISFPQSFPHFGGNSGNSKRPTANTLQDKSLNLQWT
jgi:hypothetical protein